MTRKRTQRDGSAPARRSTTVPTIDSERDHCAAVAQGWVAMEYARVTDKERAKSLSLSSLIASERAKARLDLVPAPAPPRAPHDYGLCGGVCPDCTAPEPRLRTLSDEVQELRGALIAMLWEHVGHEEESCDGDCEVQIGTAEPAEPRAACTAMRALDWGEHWDVKAFEQRASR